MTACPKCGATPAVVWMPGGAFYQRTECQCGRKTRWVACGHDATADASDDVPTPQGGCVMGASSLECAGCGKKGPDVQKRRQNTAYHDDASNWSVLCPDCQAEANEYWAERWAEYYSGCL